jgi:outer membrane lipoprotein
MTSLLAGCQSTPVITTVAAPLAATPYQVGSDAQRFGSADVVWGGMILTVHNLAETTEIEVLAYPLSSSQRPKLSAPTEGRFIAVMRGYVESQDFPQGRFVTLSGKLAGARAGRIEEHDYNFPLVMVVQMHLWKAEFQNDGPRFNMGIGIGIGR